MLFYSSQNHLYRYLMPTNFWLTLLLLSDSLSYYKVNFTKLPIFNLGVPKKYPTFVVPTAALLLGRSRYTILLHLHHWHPLWERPTSNPYIQTRTWALSPVSELSSDCRLAFFKVLFLSQILYLFCTLPIPFNPSYMTCLVFPLRKFIWQGKWARCFFIQLIKHRTIGGIVLVDIKDY